MYVYMHIYVYAFMYMNPYVYVCMYKNFFSHISCFQKKNFFFILGNSSMWDKCIQNKEKCQHQNKQQQQQQQYSDRQTFKILEQYPYVRYTCCHCCLCLFTDCCFELPFQVKLVRWFPIFNSHVHNKIMIQQQQWAAIALVHLKLYRLQICTFLRTKE